jgi:hypothetical protein
LICGEPVSNDANGNTLSCDPDGPGPIDCRTIAHDGENRPITNRRAGGKELHQTAYLDADAAQTSETPENPAALLGRHARPAPASSSPTSPGNDTQWQIHK